MPATAIRCPQCDANIDAEAGAPVTHCKYCGASVQLEQRQVAPSIESLRNFVASTQSTYVSTKVGVGIVGAIVVAALSIVALVVVPVLRQASDARHRAAALAAAAEKRDASQTKPIKKAPPVQPELHWDQLALPLMVDIDGDGVDDLVGNAKESATPNGEELVAYSGIDGHMLWKSPALLGDINKVSIVADHVLEANRAGTIKGFALRTGARTWEVELGEVIDGWCQSDDPASIVVVTHDEKTHTLDLRAGVERASAPPTTASKHHKAICTALVEEGPTDKTKPRPLPTAEEINQRRADAICPNSGICQFSDGPSLARIDHVYVSTLLPGLNGKMIAAGHRVPGTEVPIVAVLLKGVLQWQAVIPSSTPLQASWSVNLLATAGDVIAAVYRTPGAADHVFITGFSLEDGHRLWDHPFEGESSASDLAMIGNGKTIVTTSHHGLRVFDAATGALAFER